jgi:hypothetical protein
MTYKNIKFTDSEVMRSLEALSVKKGLIEPQKKQAAPVKKSSKKETRSPSTSLDANIASLCEGLRSKGFDKYADEIESKFFTYKSAEAEYYNVTGETGEDMVNRFHPDGSVELKDVEGDATVETILDQRKLIEEILKKRST